MEQKLQYIVDKIGELNIQINEKQAEQFFRYYELLVEWNGFMNLTGITDFEEVVCKHFVDSLSIISTKDMSTVDNLIDIVPVSPIPRNCSSPKCPKFFQEN